MPILCGESLQINSLLRLQLQQSSCGERQVEGDTDRTRPASGLARPSVRREAVEQSGAAGPLQRILAAAARLVRRVPRLGRRALVEPGAVVVADHRGTVAALGPVAEGRVRSAG